MSSPATTSALRTPAGRFWLLAAAAVLASRLAHRNILWADEDYHLAAAVQLLHGKMLYRDLWYDKPPLNALFDVLFGGWYGIPLRLACTLVVLATCGLGYKLAARLWGRADGFAAAALLAFFHIFYLPAAILPLEPDTLILLPALAAIYAAVEARPFLAGIAAGFAMLLTPKGVFALAPCLFFVPRAQWWMLLAGFAAPNAVALGWLAATGALADYGEQVWRWGWLYISKPGADPQAQRGGLAVLDWLGFHAALAIAAGLYFWREKEPLRWRLFAWAGIAFIAAAVGGRFAPRYFNLLMAALAIPAAHGLVLAGNAKPRRWIWLALIAVALLIPAARFGPRYVTLALEDLRGEPHAWGDVAMNLESRIASDVVRKLAKPGDTIFIWGYRPDIVAYTRLSVASRFWDSQAVTGVPADRHLSDTRSIAPSWAVANSVQLARTRPTFIVDGLSAYNPQMDIARYGRVLQPWADRYCLEARDERMTIYRLCHP